MLSTYLGGQSEARRRRRLPGGRAWAGGGPPCSSQARGSEPNIPKSLCNLSTSK